MLRHGECDELLGEGNQAKSDNWLDMVDEQIVTFKRKVRRWLKCAEDEKQRYAMSEKSRSSKQSSNKSSHHSSR